MTRPNRASIFPGHQFDFGDAVFLASLQKGGTVDGICDRKGNWQYNLSCDSQWWDEDQLEPACPQCFQSWDGNGKCPHCDYSHD